MYQPLMKPATSGAHAEDGPMTPKFTVGRSRRRSYSQWVGGPHASIFDRIVTTPPGRRSEEAGPGRDPPLAVVLFS